MLIRTKINNPSVVGILLIGLTAATLAAADSTTDRISKAIDDGDIALNLRYRYEFVDQKGLPKDAGASTLRSRVTLTSGNISGFHGVVEVDNVAYLGGDNFNNTENGKTAYPVVADPDYTEINQAFINYAFNEKNTAAVGRQRIDHAGQRFLGGVAWRQNEQTFDAARIQLTPLEGLTVDYSYIWQVNRIFGPEGADAEFEGDTHATLLSYKIAEGHTVSAFSYILDFDEAPALSSKTYGLDYIGAVKLSESVGLGIQLTAAKQKEHDNNPADFSANYYLGELTTRFKPFSLSLGREVLSSDNGVSFKTPLATLHKFQGFADNFLVTPVNGIEDSYLKLATNIAGVTLIAFYHDFKAEKGGMDYGSEMDFVATYPISKNYSVLFKYAAYDADDFSVDTDKAWLELSAAF